MIIDFKDGESEAFDGLDEEVSMIENEIFDCDNFDFTDSKGIWHFINTKCVKEVRIVPYISDKQYEEMWKKEEDLEKYGALKIEQTE